MIRTEPQKSEQKATVHCNHEKTAICHMSQSHRLQAQTRRPRFSIAILSSLIASSLFADNGSVKLDKTLPLDTHAHALSTTTTTTLYANPTPLPTYYITFARARTRTRASTQNPHDSRDSQGKINGEKSKSI